jgi:dipeptidyl aminopeptidase/acylaminoacyl peptidase
LIWDVLTGWPVEPSSELRIGQTPVGFAPDGRLVLIDDDGVLLLLDLTSGQEQATAVRRLHVRSGLSFSPDGKLLACWGGPFAQWRDEGEANHPCQLRLCDLAAGRERVLIADTQRAEDIRDVRFSPDGRTLVTASADGILDFWDVATGACRERVVLDGTAGFQEFRLSPDLRHVLAIRNWIRPLGAIQIRSQPLNELQLWVMSSSGQWQQQVALEEVDESRAVWFADEGQALALSEDYRPNVSLEHYLPHMEFDARTAVIRNVEVGWKEVLAVPVSYEELLSCLPNGHTLAIHTDRGLELWDLRSRRPVEIVLASAATAALLAAALVWWVTGPSRQDRRPAETA